MTFPIKGILNLTRRLLGGGWLPLALVTLPYMLANWAIWFGQKAIMHTSWNPDWHGAFVSSQGLGPLALIFIAVTWLLRGFHMGAVTEIALRVAASKPIRPAGLLITAAISALPVLLLRILVELIVTVGSIFLVIPGLLLGAAFSVIVPAYVCEGKGLVEALGQSFKITRHRLLPIAGVWSAILVVYGLATGSFLFNAKAVETSIHWLWPSLPLPTLPDPAASISPFSSPAGLLIDAVARQVAGVGMMVLNVSIYLALRFHKTNAADNQIAAIFE